jgi:hypothetical protein
MQNCANTPPGGWHQQPAAALATQQQQRLGTEVPLWVRRWLAEHSAPRSLPPLHSLQGRYTMPSQLTGAARGGEFGAAAAACCLLSSGRHCRSLCSAAGQRDGCARAAAALPTFRPVFVVDQNVSSVCHSMTGAMILHGATVGGDRCCQQPQKQSATWFQDGLLYANTYVETETHAADGQLWRSPGETKLRCMRLLT